MAKHQLYADTSRTSLIVGLLMLCCLVSSCKFEVKDVQDFQFSPTDSVGYDANVGQDAVADTALDQTQPKDTGVDVCKPDCTDKECGTDGCSSDCGVCEEGWKCEAGSCIDPVLCQNGVCDPGDGENCGSCPDDCPCASNKTCFENECCLAQSCEETKLECGTHEGADGCGGTLDCGECLGGEAWSCSDEGVCICAPSCDGISCGSDGCDGDCGNCPASETCSPEGHCVPAACKEDEECAAFEMVCDEEAQVCVHCMESLDCPEDEFCQGPLCVPDVCEAGMKQCDQEGWLECALDGSGWTGTQPCEEEHYCQDGQCLEWVCPPGTSYCLGNDVAQCEDDGSAFEIITQCGEEGVCQGDECAEKICQPDSTQCVTAVTFQECGPLGLGWLEEAFCNDGTYCSFESEACVPWNCQPFDQICEGDEGMLVCDEHGSAESYQPCPPETVCEADECKQQICQPGSTSCMDDITVEECNETGTAYADHYFCEPDQYCNFDIGGCDDQICPPGSVVCIDLNTQQVCNDAGSGFEEVPCPDESVCQVDECRDVICEAGEEKYCVDLYTFQKCNEFGTDWYDKENCPPDTFCEGGNCKDQLCQPGESICFGKYSVQVCDDTGGNYLPPEDCPSGHGCVGGQCVKQECEPGAMFCSGNDIVLCNDDGTEATIVKECGEKQQCVNGACDPPFLTPWARLFGNAGNDYIHDMAVDDDGNVYVAGFHTGTADGTITTAGGSDILVGKLDSSGATQWVKFFGGTHDDRAYGIDIDESGNIYITGEFKSGSIVFGSDTLTNQGWFNSDGFLVKLNQYGTPVWATSFGSNKMESGIDVVVDSVQRPWVTGFFNGSTLDFGCNETILSNQGGTDVFLTMFDSSGTCLGTWQPVMSDGDELGVALAVDQKDGVYLTGTFSGVNIWWWGDSILTNELEETDDVFVVKFQPGSGTAEWASSLGGQGNDRSLSIAVDDYQRAYVTGEFKSSTIEIGQDSWTNASVPAALIMADVFMVKYDTEGNPEWSRAFGGTGTDRAESVATDSSGNSYLAGYYNSASLTLGGQTFTGTANDFLGKDIFVGMFQPNGEHIWSESLGGNGDDLIYAVVPFDNSTFYLGGHTTSSDLSSGGNELGSEGGYDVYVSKHIQ